MDVAEIQRGALTLPEDLRAKLVASLLESLPAVLSDCDDGSNEAQRRLTELKQNPSVGRNWNQIKTGLGR